MQVQQKRLDTLVLFMNEEYIVNEVTWDHLMEAWLKLRSRTWQINNGGYPAWFAKHMEDWKRECFNATFGTAFEVLVNAINDYEANLPKPTLPH